MIMNTNEIYNEQTLKKICKYLRVDREKIQVDNFEDQIKCACVERFYKSLGVKRDCNNPSKYFNFLSVVAAQAVCNKFNVKLTIAPDKFRCFRYDGFNLIEQVEKYLENESVDLAFTEAFTFLDKYTYLV